MATNPSAVPNTMLARLPAPMRDAYEHYRLTGDASSVQEIVVASVLEYRPKASAAIPACGEATRLIEDLGYDSVAVAELVFFLEDIFDLTLSNEDIMGVRTIGDLRACVARKLAAKPRGA
jgi:acyl carrier protein